MHQRQRIETPYSAAGAAARASSENTSSRASFSRPDASKSYTITATRDENGEVVEGNPEKLTTVREVWTFERDLTSRDPNWRLVATEAAR